MKSHPTQPRRNARPMVVAAAAAVLVLVGGATPTGATTDSGVLYYTTFSPARLKRVAFSLEGGTVVLGARRTVATLKSADGVVFDTTGALLVGGADLGTIYRVDPGTGLVSTVGAGGPAFLVSVDPAGQRAWTAGLPGPLSRVPLDPLGDGTQVPLVGDQTAVTGLAFDASGNAFYTESGPDGYGSFGRIDLSSGRTTRLLADLPGAHGIVYDAFSRSLLVFGGTSVFQIDPAAPTGILSSRTIPEVQLDSGTADGRGHLFLASNYGQLAVIGYSSSRRIGDPSSSVSVQMLDANLDDVAPLSGPGSNQPARLSAFGTLAAGTGVAVPVAAGGFLAVRRLRRRSARGLPSWAARAGAA